MALLASLSALMACPARAATCETPKVDPEDKNGLAVLTLNSPCRRGEPLRATLDDVDYPAKFDAEGVAKLNLPLTRPKSTIDVSFDDGSSQSGTAVFANMDKVLRVYLSWDAPVALDLHVREPGYGDVARSAPRREGQVGEIDAASDGAGSPPFLQSYVYPKRADNPAAIFGISVEYTSRGHVPKSEYCGDGAYANVHFTVTTVDRGVVARQFYEIPSAPCGQSIPPRGYLIRVQ
jgi:hypothetical protein